MALLSAIFRRSQAEVAPPSYDNDLADIGAHAMAAAAAKPMLVLDYQPVSAAPSRKRAASTSVRVSPAGSMARRYQINVRLNKAERDDLRRYAKQHRLGIGEAVRLAIARLTAPQ